MKAVLSLVTAIVMAIIVANNLRDYTNGLAYTAAAMSMTYVPDNPLKSRAITDPRYHRLFYHSVIAWEALTAVLCGLGALLLWRRHPAGLRMAQWGHVTGAALFMGAFRGVAGQCWLMWRAGVMNGLPDAHRFIGWFIGVLGVITR